LEGFFFYLDNVYLVARCVVVDEILCIRIRMVRGEVECNIQLILVFLVHERERGRLVERDPHEIVGSADFASEDTRLWLNNIEGDFYALRISLARYL